MSRRRRRLADLGSACRTGRAFASRLSAWCSSLRVRRCPGTDCTALETTSACSAGGIPLPWSPWPSRCLRLAAATWMLAAPVKPLVGPRFLTSLLGLLVLAGTALSFVYLPLKARFVVAPFGSDLGLKGLSSVGTYLRGEACPAPGPGLLGPDRRRLIVLGGLRLQSRRASQGHVESSPT